MSKIEDAVSRVTAYLDEMDRVSKAIPGRPQYGDEVHGINDLTLRRSDLRAILAGVEASSDYALYIERQFAREVLKHTPVQAGSSQSNIPGTYSGDWIICSCNPGRGAWHYDAPRIPIADYPDHLLKALGLKIDLPTYDQKQEEGV